MSREQITQEDLWNLWMPLWSPPQRDRMLKPANLIDEFEVERRREERAVGCIVPAAGGFVPKSLAGFKVIQFRPRGTPTPE